MAAPRLAGGPTATTSAVEALEETLRALKADAQALRGGLRRPPQPPRKAAAAPLLASKAVAEEALLAPKVAAEAPTSGPRRPPPLAISSPAQPAPEPSPTGARRPLLTAHRGAPTRKIRRSDENERPSSGDVLNWPAGGPVGKDAVEHLLLSALDVLSSRVARRSHWSKVPRVEGGGRFACVLVESFSPNARTNIVWMPPCAVRET
ncbi:unnamed protein product [Prorocentrum cordatum]|uniref:Uncharacterized protein n=1 Tax=Prorocentrum cordatum TaxID=2364126 RepID=A0ABN9VED4_9DINO|nr:unnamed protein product [Polarella glacialis]